MMHLQALLSIAQVFDGTKNIDGMQFIDKFDGKNIDRQHLRLPVLAEIIERRMC